MFGAADVVAGDAVTSVLAGAVARFGTIHIVVNCAGIGARATRHQQRRTTLARPLQQGRSSQSHWYLQCHSAGSQSDGEEFSE
jgi:NAD(P)-dependent dehydrogenase (short-subunit alcohol dehydrogenase family)